MKVTPSLRQCKSKSIATIPSKVSLRHAHSMTYCEEDENERRLQYIRRGVTFQESDDDDETLAQNTNRNGLTRQSTNDSVPRVQSRTTSSGKSTRSSAMISL